MRNFLNGLTIATVIVIGSFTGLFAMILAQPVELPPLPAVRLPIAATLHAGPVTRPADNPDYQEQNSNRVPDGEDHPGHFHRPDGRNCKKDGAGGDCKCQVICPTEGAENPQYKEDSRCEWYCHHEKCTCHHCPELECSDGHS